MQMPFMRNLAPAAPEKVPFLRWLAPLPFGHSGAPDHIAKK